jgi:hypothetical protein
MFYLVDDHASRACRIAQTGISAGAGPQLVELAGGSAPWALADAYRGGEVIELDDVAAAAPYARRPPRRSCARG